MPLVFDWPRGRPERSLDARDESVLEALDFKRVAVTVGVRPAAEAALAASSPSPQWRRQVDAEATAVRVSVGRRLSRLPA